MRFFYTGTNYLGKNITGTINAASKVEAQELLAQQSIDIITIHLDEKNLINKLNIFHYPKTSDLIIFSKQMYSLLRSGVPIIKSINIVSDTSKNQQLSTTLTDIANKLEAGCTLSVAMEKYPKIFPKLMLSLITIGEQTGVLANMFKQIALHLEKENKVFKEIKTAIRYPIIVVCTIIAAMITVNVMVIPSFVKIFTQFNAKLPLITQVIMFISNAIIHYWWVFILSIVMLAFGFIKFINSTHGKFLWDKYKIKAPIIGNIIERSILSRFARSFALCCKTGVPLLESLNLLASTCNNSYIESKIIEIRNNIAHGATLAIASKNTGIFDGLILQMMLVGEESGKIEELLEEVSSFYDEELSYDIKTLSSLIEPLLIIFLASMIMVLALGIFLPIWSLGQVTSGSV